MIRPEELGNSIDDFVWAGMEVVLLMVIVGGSALLAMTDLIMFLIIVGILAFFVSIPVLGYIALAIIINVNVWRKDEL